jgi:hypothetical protein
MSTSILTEELVLFHATFMESMVELRKEGHSSAWRGASIDEECKQGKRDTPLHGEGLR